MRRRPYLWLRRLARRLGYHLVRADYYSPIPDRWDPDLWEHPAEMPGVDLRLDAAADLLSELAPYIAEYAPPAEAPGTKHGFHYLNYLYPQMDAEMLYAMVRHVRPRRLVEIGAGWSSRVIADAVDHAAPVEHRIFDPFPADHMASLGASVERLPAQEVPAGIFAGLEGGDMLVIDTTHTITPGGDVVRLILEVLPRLAPGVIVHVHDIFLPYSYPEFTYHNGLFWQEQWLVQALLACSDRFEVIMANYAMSRLRSDAVARAGLGREVAGSALWLRVAG